MDKRPRFWSHLLHAAVTPSSLLLPLLILLSTLVSQTHVEATWWSLSQLPVSALSLVDSGAICDNIPGLVSRQRRLCRSQPDVMMCVVRGAKLSVTECQGQFTDHRWNCSTSPRDSTVFGKTMLVGSREAAFVYSISSASVVHAITRGCSKGDLLNCACDPTRKGTSYDKEKKEFEWGGCSDNVNYGRKFSRMFIDAHEKRRRDARALMNLHNNRAGRRSVQKFMKLKCKCHGVSGSCTVRTCWRAMQDFTSVGAYLRKKYNGATKVSMNQKGTELVVANRNHKKPTRNDMVYFEDSPDYCIQDAAVGSHGTAGRECNRTSLGTDGCDIMCCGRGYDTRTVERVRKCECKFHWCCVVKCKQCKEWVDVHTCKGPNPTPPTPNEKAENNMYGFSKRRRIL